MKESLLASCQIIPQQVSIAIEGGVHIDGLFLAAVVLMLVLIRMRRVVLVEDGPSCVVRRSSGNGDWPRASLLAVD